MESAGSYKQYQRNQIEMASQKQLILMLYDGAIKFLRLAKEGIEEQNLELAHNALIRSQAIVLELLTGLNPDSGKVSEGLSSLYDYFYQRLVEANKEKDTEIIDEIIPYLQDLRGVWEQLEEEEENKKPQMVKEKPTKEELSERISLRG